MVLYVISPNRNGPCTISPTLNKLSHKFLASQCYIERTPASVLKKKIDQPLLVWQSDKNPTIVYGISFLTGLLLACAPLPFKENQGFKLFVGFCMCAIVLFLPFSHLLISLLCIWAFQADRCLQHGCGHVQFLYKAIPFPLDSHSMCQIR